MFALLIVAFTIRPSESNSSDIPFAFATVGSYPFGGINSTTYLPFDKLSN
nr:hypothetical protein [Staphylococcus felis]